MTRILFVDDETGVLDGLRQALHAHHDWDAVFVTGGAAALDECRRAAFDVVVSDMRMPSMDATALLSRIRDDFPQTARIVLSGQAERHAIVKAMPIAHQYLIKPVDIGHLHAVIERTCHVQALLHDHAVRGIVTGLDTLPSAPKAYLAITEAASQSTTSLDDITDIVEQDPALVARILQIANSAYFGLHRSVTSIRQAVQHLGTDVIKGLALSGQVFGTTRIAPFEGFSLEELQRHSLLTARVAKRLSTGLQQCDEVFTAAMVHDIGQVILATGFRDRFAAARQTAQREGRPFHEVEFDEFGASHAEVGACLLGMWGLPFAIVEATAFHHRPRQVPSGERQLLAAIHLADVLINTAAPDRTDHVVEQRLDVGFLDECGIAPDFARWGAIAKRELQALETV